MGRLKKYLRLKVYLYLEILITKVNKIFPNKGVILMFHHITDEQLEENPSCVHSVGEFRSIIDKLKNDGYTFITLNDLYNRHNNRIAIVTFDDCYEDVYYNAYPYLKDQNIPFVMYISNCYIDKKGFISKDQLIEMSKDSLVTVGYHTFSHPQLLDVEKLGKEIIEQKHEIERIIDKPLIHFAYPYGKFYATGFRAINEVKKNGYETAVSTIPTYLSRFTMSFRYFLPRIVRL